MTVTIIRSPDIDYETGDPVDGDPTRIPVTDCTIGPRQDASNEIHKHARDGVVDEKTIYRRPPFEFRHTDKVELPDGLVYDVEGYPATWPDGVVVNLRRTAG